MTYKPPFEIRTSEGISGGKSQLVDTRTVDIRGVEQHGVPIPSDVFLKDMKMKTFEQLDSGGYFEYSSVRNIYTNEIEHRVKITVVEPERKSPWERIDKQ